jgi:hypothetical protein
MVFVRIHIWQVKREKREIPLGILICMLLTTVAMQELPSELLMQKIQQKTEERVKALQSEQESLLDGSITPEKD